MLKRIQIAQFCRGCLHAKGTIISQPLEHAFSKILTRHRPPGDPVVRNKPMVLAPWRNTKAGSCCFFLAAQDFFSVVAEPEKLEQPPLPTVRPEIFQALKTNP